MRTIIEINHDYLTPRTREELERLFLQLGSSEVTTRLNRNDGDPFNWEGCGIRVLAQRHHSEKLTLEVS